MNSNLKGMSQKNIHSNVGRDAYNSRLEGNNTAARSKKIIFSIQAKQDEHTCTNNTSENTENHAKLTQMYVRTVCWIMFVFS